MGGNLDSAQLPFFNQREPFRHRLNEHRLRTTLVLARVSLSAKGILRIGLQTPNVKVHHSSGRVSGGSYDWFFVT